MEINNEIRMKNSSYVNIDDFDPVGRWIRCPGAPLIADVLLPLVVAHLAFDVAAPDEATVAFLFDVPHPGLVSATTAQQATAI